MKAAAIVISILLVIVLLTGAVSTLSSGFTNFEVRSWLDRFVASEEPIIEEPVEEDPIDEEPIIEEPVEEDPIDEEPEEVSFLDLSKEEQKTLLLNTFGPVVDLSDIVLDEENIEEQNLLDDQYISWNVSLFQPSITNPGYTHYEGLINLYGLLDLLEDGSSYSVTFDLNGELYSFEYLVDFTQDCPLGYWIFQEGCWNPGNYTPGSLGDYIWHTNNDIVIQSDIDLTFSFSFYTLFEYPGVLFLRGQYPNFGNNFFNQYSVRLISIIKI